MNCIRYFKINPRLSACLCEARRQALICGFCSFFFLCFPGFIYSWTKTEKDSLSKLLNRNLIISLKNQDLVRYPKEDDLPALQVLEPTWVRHAATPGHNNFRESILRNEYPNGHENLQGRQIMGDIKAGSLPKKNLSLLIPTIIPTIEEKYFKKTQAELPGKKILPIKAFAPKVSLNLADKNFEKNGGKAILNAPVKNKKQEKILTDAKEKKVLKVLLIGKTGKTGEKIATKKVSKIIPVKSADLSSQIIGPFWRKKFDLAKIRKNSRLKTKQRKVRSSDERQEHEILALTGTSPQKKELIKRSSKSLPRDLYELNSFDSPFLTKSAKLFQKDRNSAPGKFYELKVLFKNRQFGKAVKIVDSFTPGMQNYVEALFMKSQSYEYLQKYSEAIVSYIKLSRKFPDNPLADDSLQAAALLYKKGGNVVGAVSLLVEILQYYPKGDKVDSALFFLGLIHEKSHERQNWKLAESFYKEVINRSGKDKKATSPFVRKSQMALLRLKQE